MTLVERVQSVANLAGQTATEQEFLRQFGQLWREMRVAVALMEQLGNMQCAWKEGRDKVTTAKWN